FPSESAEEEIPSLNEEDLVGLPTRDQLDALTAHEPESVDAHEIPEDIIIDRGPEISSSAPVAMDEFPSFEMEDVASKDLDVSLEGGTDSDLPDLSDMSIGETHDIPIAESSDIPDIDMGSFGEMPGSLSLDETSEAAPATSAFERGSDRVSPLEDMATFEEAPVNIDLEVPHELADELPDIPSMAAINDVVEHEPIPQIDEDIHAFGDLDDNRPAESSAAAPAQGIDLSESELKKLKHAIMLFPHGLIRAVKDVILNDRLPEPDTRILVNMILSGRNENDIRRFIEDRLHEKIEMEEEIPHRRVISSRNEYSTGEGRRRQKLLFKRTKIAAIGILVVAMISVLGYQFVYKPYKAKSLITEGVALILKKGDISDEMKNYRKAEDLFDLVNREYVENYLPGYHRYARAYFDKKQYLRSLQKLNAAYDIRPSNVDTLLALGYFYKKVPVPFYDDDAKPNLKAWYYKKAPPAVERIRDKFDVAIDFYLKAKHLDPKNITALVGIGDVYFIKGEFLKARQYYENILKIDPDSVAGYSGLINLFIERDDFSDLLTIFVELREKDLFPEIPSPLLGNFAEYLLSKAAKEDSNIRIDYGIQSERIKDTADNPFPAVRTILDALHKKDPDYPPLYLHYAKLSLAQKNPALVKGYLEQAISHAEDRGERYFGALSMMGEYYYRMKDPVKSYSYLKDAIASLTSPPDFTREDFYKETETPGRTKAVMGNIFYYFFDKVTARFGDNTDEANLEEEAPDADAARMVNYDIAMKKYEAAVADGYSSSELHYNLGRIYYLKGLYDNAVNEWLNNYEDFTTTPELMFALGNAFYHMNNPESAKAEYQKLISLKEHEADSITTVVPTRADHIRLFSSLSAAYNNLGAVYLRKGGDTRSNICFWKSIDYAHRLGHESEFARVNLARTIRKKGDTRQPVLDENIPFSVNLYRAEDRDRYELK
ncbi:MAG TPA: tetratricopeptide repeat protein, partial [Spirochaetota bacterium]